MKLVAFLTGAVLVPVALVLGVAIIGLTAIESTRPETTGTPTADTVSCASDAECTTPGHIAVAWAEAHLGAPYAAINPYRLGTPAWPGGTLTGFRGDRYTYPAGTTVFDCSGLVIAGWRAAGVDVVAEYGIVSSQQFATSLLPDAPLDALQRGDIAVYRPGRTGVGHVVLIHHVDADGSVWTIEATPTKGVHIGHLNWSKVSAVKRLLVVGPVAVGLRIEQ
jgi:cell wall-associated NlpC family hydrolase